MTDSASASASASATAAAGTAIGWTKILSVAKTIFTSPLTLAAIASAVVLLMTMPKTKKQQFVALLSTFLGSIFGGAFAIEHYQLAELSRVAVGGVYLLAGLTIWVVLRGYLPIPSAIRRRESSSTSRKFALPGKATSNGF